MSTAAVRPLRLFCALRLPEAALVRVQAWQERALRGGRLVAPGQLHVTLAFLGSTPAVALPAVAATLRDAAARARPIRFTVTGYRETRSVGMLTLADELDHAAGLAADVADGLAVRGLLRREARPWLAHLTVLRFRARPLLAPAPPNLGVVSPSDAAVYSSLLRPGGARYEIVETTPLGG